MINTGIVRRIDDLGRVAIPKEIRRQAGLIEGDPLQVFVGQNGDVIFRKYSPLGSIKDKYVSNILSNLSSSTNTQILLTDKEIVLDSYGYGSLTGYKMGFVDAKIGDTFGKALEGRQLKIYEHMDFHVENKRISYTYGGAINESVILAPIIVDDVYGSIIMLIPSDKSTDAEIQTVKFAVDIIVSHLS